MYDINIINSTCMGFVTELIYSSTNHNGDWVVRI